MKKYIIASIIILGFSTNAFAYVQPIPCGTKGNCEYKLPRELSSDVIDLQNQINQLNQKNSQLEAKIFQLENKPQTQVVSQTPQASINDASQNVRIETLEKKVSLLETAVKGVKDAVYKTLELLNKLLKLI